MNSHSKKNWNPIVLGIVVFVLIAALADIQYRGKFFQLLPERVQAYLEY